MLTELHQDCTMTPDTQASLSGDLSEAAAFLQAFAAAPDWQDGIDALWMALPHVLPDIRVDIYAAGLADLATLVFSSSQRPVLSPALASVTDAQARTRGLRRDQDSAAEWRRPAVWLAGARALRWFAGAPGAGSRSAAGAADCVAISV